MDTLGSLLLFALVFCIIVVSHEFGHFLVSKINGVRVTEFTIGVGPKIFSYKKNGTLFSIRLLPFGGACIYDMDLDDEADDDKEEDKDKDKEKNDEAVASSSSSVVSDRGFLDEQQGIPYPDAPVMSRIAILIAGPMFNFITAFLLAVIVVWNAGSASPVIKGLIEGYPAEEAGMQVGDKITKMNGSRVYLADEIHINSYLNQERPMTIEYIRDGKKNTVTIIPKYDEEAGRYLIGFNGYGEHVDCKGLNVFRYALYEVRYGFVGTGKGLLTFISGRGSKDDWMGPVGMAQTIDEVKDSAAPYGLWVVMLNIFSLSMWLSINLGILNLLPLPAIDGGKLIFVILEALRGKPVPPEKEGIVHLVGFALLLMLAVAVTYNDIIRLIHR